MPSKETIVSVLVEAHTPVIDNYHEKLWFVVCGDNNFIGYWDEDTFTDDAGWNADEVSTILNMKKGEALQHFSSSMHTIVCVK